MKPTKSQYAATGKFHEKAAKALESLGQKKNAESAKRAAAICALRAAEVVKVVVFPGTTVAGVKYFVETNLDMSSEWAKHLVETKQARYV